MSPSQFRKSADKFTRAYVEAALWSTSAEIAECTSCDTLYTPPKLMTDGDTCPVCKGHVYGKDKSFQDREMGVEEMAPETLDAIVADCKAFQEANEQWITAEFCLTRRSADIQAGHDFWLTRNEHGCGFWETSDWVNPGGEALHRSARWFGAVSLYLGDDGLIYQG